MLIREYRAGDEADIMRLLSSLGWTHLASRRSWDWEFQECPDGPAIITVAEDDGRIVGHYSCLPVRMQCGALAVSGAKSEGSAVEPGYRGAGARHQAPDGKPLFQSLVERLFVTADQQGKALLWGFTGESTLKAHQRPGYDCVRLPLTVLIAPVNLGALLAARCPKPLRGAARLAGACVEAVLGAIYLYRMAKETGGSSNVTVTEVLEFDARLDQFWEAVAGQQEWITICRDRRYANWRFVSNPNASYHRFVAEAGGRVVGYLVASVHQGARHREGHVIDVLALREHLDGVDRLIRAAMDVLRKHGAELVHTWVVRGNPHAAPYARRFRRQGFWLQRPTEWPMVIRAHGPHAPNAYVMNPDNWYITMAFTEGTF